MEAGEVNMGSMPRLFICLQNISFNFNRNFILKKSKIIFIFVKKYLRIIKWKE